MNIIMPIFVNMQIEIPSHVNKAALAKQLWPELSRQVRTAKFHNKLNNWCRMRFTEPELEKIKNILK